MNYVELGKTNLLVSRLCFGALTIGPLQANLPPSEGGKVIAKALSLGVNFIDTAELYQTYDHIRHALTDVDKQVIIASKSYAYDWHGMRRSLDLARKKLNRDCIEIFLLHEQESLLTIKGHREALNFLVSAKGKGLVKAVGLSTHSVQGVLAAADLPEIDVIHPIINLQGLGIMDGTITEMLAAIKVAWDKGIGVYSMKPLGGGNLISQAEKALHFVFSHPHIHAVAVGMQSMAEVEANVSICNGNPVAEESSKKISLQKRSLHVETWCSGCGSCISHCKYGALKIGSNRVVVKQKKCMLCGYCGSACPNFCIKII